MTGAAIGLVLLSALAHASWNYFAKHGKTPELFTWWMALSANIIMAPLAIVLLILNTPSVEGWIFILATWLLHIAYFMGLSRAYANTDLSIAYPLARGLGLMLIPVLGLLWLGETISAAAWIGAALILTGIFTLTWWGRFKALITSPGWFLNDIGVRYALATGVVISIYSVVDKQGVEHVTPFLYMYFVTAAGTLGMLPFVMRDFSRAQFASEWRTYRVTIVAGGLLQFAAYGLVLTAFELARVSYVGPFREIGIVAGVIMGAVLLKEPFGRGRIFGAGIIGAGAITIALAP